MNGAAMDCRQDQVLHSQQKGSRGLHSPGYHFQINRSRQQNSHPQHSKTKNYQLLSETVLLDRSSEYLQHKNLYDVDSRQKSVPSDIWDPRCRTPHPRTREPLELPVPQFLIDENYVGEPPPVKEDRCRPNSVEDTKSLDLDTRIDLLIKSKALAGMHPIFSELDQSGESSYDSDESFLNLPKLKKKLDKKRKSLPLEEKIVCHEIFYDPETPLSRPPSPFLSRATYLFWFNKAIEIKQQAKAQEQALLEKANKRLLQDNISAIKTVDKINRTSPNKDSKPIIKSLLDEISKEIKEVVKQEFVKEVLQNAAFSALENWWEKQCHSEEGNTMESSVMHLFPDEYNPSDKTMDDNVCLNNELKAEYQGSTSPKVPFPGIKVKREIDEKLSNLNNKDSLSKENTSNRTSIINDLSRTYKSETLGEVKTGHGPLLVSECLKKEVSVNEKEDQKTVVTSSDETVGHSSEQDPAPLLHESKNISRPVSKLTEPNSEFDRFSDHAYALTRNSSSCVSVAEGNTPEDINQTVRNTLNTIISNIENKTKY